jgi:hypothetical protein
LYRYTAVSGATMTIKFTGVTLESASLGLPPLKLPSPLVGEHRGDWGDWLTG